MADREKWLKKSYSFQSLQEVLPQLVRPLHKGKSSTTAYIFSDWPLVVGAEIAACCRPLKLNYSKDRQVATLHLAVSDGQALLLQYKEAEICERIAQYLGYTAVHKIKLLQVPELPEQKAQKPIAKLRSPAKMREARETVEKKYALQQLDASLQNALLELGASLEIDQKG